MTTIEAGTPVRVVTEGTLGYVTFGYGAPEFVIDSASGGSFSVSSVDPAVTVTTLDPERPALDRETIARAVDPAAWRMGVKNAMAASLERADAILALIQAAHPEWTL